MNKIIFLENLGEDSYRLTESNGYDFLKNIEKFCYESFTQNSQSIRTFAFILNDNNNNYFAELLSNNKFIKDFDKLIHDKITVFWCEPKIFDNENSINHFQHFVKIRGLDPTEIWDKLFKKLKKYPDFNNKKTNVIFPALFLLSVERIKKGHKYIYPLLDMYCISLNTYEHFNNIEIFRDKVMDLFKDILHLIPNNASPNTSIPPFFTLNDVNKEIIKEIFKIIIKSGYPDLLSFAEDLFENIGS